MTPRAYIVRVVGLLCGVAALSLGLRGCELVVAAWDLGPVPQVHPAIRAWDAGARE